MTALDAKRRALADQLRELGVRFAERNVADLASLERGLARLSAGDRAAAAEMEAIAHRISGVGATLGFADISDAAQAVEQLAANAGDDEVATLARALAHLRAAVSRADQRS